MKKQQKGFTLVELMVVIVIIGILSALAIPRFLGATSKAKVSEFKPVLKQLFTLENAYQQERQTYLIMAPIAFDAVAVNPAAVQLGFDLPPGQRSFTYDVATATATTFTSQAIVGRDIAGVTTGEGATIDQAGNRNGSGGAANDLTRLANWQ